MAGIEVEVPIVLLLFRRTTVVPRARNPAHYLPVGKDGEFTTQTWDRHAINVKN